jgi:putative spermidine/putrescine transport system substrate-binding protein
VTTVLDSFLTADEQDTLRTEADEDIMAKWSEGFGELKSLGPSMYQEGVYPNGNTQVLEMLGSGEISMAPVWSDQFLTSQQSGLIGENIAFTQISDPSFTGNASYLGIPKTSDDTDGAIDLVNFVLSSEGQQIIAEQISGYPVVDLSTLPQEVQDQFVDADPSALRPGYYSEVGSEMSNQWDQLVP